MSSNTFNCCVYQAAVDTFVNNFTWTHASCLFNTIWFIYKLLLNGLTFLTHPTNKRKLLSNTVAHRFLSVSHVWHTSEVNRRIGMSHESPITFRVQTKWANGHWCVSFASRNPPHGAGINAEAGAIAHYIYVSCYDLFCCVEQKRVWGILFFCLFSCWCHSSQLLFSQQV